MKKTLMAMFLTVALFSIIVPVPPTTIGTLNHGVNG